MSNYALGNRNRQADFVTAVLENGLSIERRPDAVSFDYLTAFGLGPRRELDVSAGIIDRPWRVRAVGNDIYLARTSDDGMSWVDEKLLFSIEGAPPLEIDLAFDQQGRSVVCVERATGTNGAKHVWLYWYDSTVADFRFTDLGPGWSPRILMDDPVDTTEADLQIFYFCEGVGLARREQRDRYSVQYDTPIKEWENRYVEDVGYIKWFRFAVIYTIRDPVSGRYSLSRIESKLYPYRSFDRFSARASLRSVSIINALIHQSTSNEFAAGAALESILLYEPIIHETIETEGFGVVGTVNSVDLIDVLIHKTIQPDEIGPNATLNEIQIYVFLIHHDTGHESTAPSAAIQSVALETP